MNRHNTLRARSGFTLLELLVTIAIILTLMGMLFPAVMQIVKRGKARRVAVQLQAIVTAAKSYKNEYGRWPGQAAAPVADRLKDEITDHALFLNDLTNNPRNFQFIEIDPSWLRGAGTNTFVDPWGRELYIALDRNGDGDVKVEPVLGAGYFDIRRIVPNNTAAAMSWGPNPEDEDSIIRSWSL